jgi:hypothetical protein
MLALIDQSGTTWAHALDLAAGCADAWVRAALGRPVVRDSLFLLAAALPSVIAETAMAFSLIPPQSWRVALQGAFWFLMLLLNGPMFFGILFAFAWAFRNAWKQWFNTIHGREHTVVRPPSDSAWMRFFNVIMSDGRSSLYEPSRRQSLALMAVILIAAAGAHFAWPGNTSSSHWGLIRIWMTYWMLKQARVFLMALGALTIRADHRSPRIR